MVRICFVCLGNICRSPTAEGVMQFMVDQQGLGATIQLDSAGTGAYHAGEKADERSRSAARKRGYRLTSIARQFVKSDFERFDYVLAMDQSNLNNLKVIAPDGALGGQLRMFRSFDPKSSQGDEVPDPYYGGGNGFDEVLDICEAACSGLLECIRREHGI